MTKETNVKELPEFKNLKDALSVLQLKGTANDLLLIIVKQAEKLVDAIEANLNK